MSTPIFTYTLTIHAPHEPQPYSMPGLALHMDRFLRETEENLTDLLPNGWHVEIHEWDEPFDEGFIATVRDRINVYGKDNDE